MFLLMTSLNVARKLSGGITRTDASKEKLKDMRSETFSGACAVLFRCFLEKYVKSIGGLNRL